ncbi:hypothetical protein [Glycomyces sp. NPDC021274]|uniref:hypothetical protein n=1 Tax=Glycomyces sp. NPDC021274 TaxID=3155120 RepID=UPI0033EAD52D
MRYLLLIPLIPASIFVEAWLLMLLVGVVHGEWLPMMPTIGYWSSVLVVLMATAITVATTFLAELGKGVVGAGK